MGIRLSQSEAIQLGLIQAKSSASKCRNKKQSLMA